MKRLAAVALVVALVSGCERKDAPAPEQKAAPAAPAPAPAPAAAAAAKAGGPRVVEMSVTAKGFEPKDVTVNAGEPVELVITRKTEATCATEILIDGVGVSQKLPLNETVRVAFTPKDSGELRYGCAMDKMIGGVIKVK